MNNLRKFFAVAMLSLIVVLPTFAGQIDVGKTPPSPTGVIECGITPPPPQPSTTSAVTTPDSTTIAGLVLLQNVLALF